MACREGITPLSELSGSDDNVLVKAKVTYIEDLDTHKPYQKGLLYDPSISMDQTRWFVVYDPDVRLEEGGYYLLNGRDYEFERFDQIQIVLGEDPYVKELYTPN